MSDLAKLTKVTSEDYQGYQPPYQHIDVVEVEDIELFVAQSQLSESLPSLPNKATQLTRGLPIKEAARILGISANSVRAKLKSGELSGCKVKGSTGEQWLVELTKVTSEPTKLTNQATQTIEPVATGEISRLLDIIERQASKLEAASGQIGYLQSQLENSRDQVKLLEDRSKSPWWLRFWKALKG